MGMNPSKLDRWPRYERVHFVLVKRGHRYERPWQGFVVGWRRAGRGWEALVTYVDEQADGSGVHTDWFPQARLRPVEVDPNPPRDDWF
ncbi:hypothetical protein [Aeromicrobium sp. Root495]|uniref:hypothetical protein n=1 Tax=Aeromicrobium sp. Root495 TaxID=1736550 RepID=UPI0012E823BB|nr:hypothetical protein [Aeromicrobium sp. Root495]